MHLERDDARTVLGWIKEEWDIKKEEVKERTDEQEGFRPERRQLKDLLETIQANCE